MNGLATARGNAVGADGSDGADGVGARLAALRTRAADWVRERRADRGFRCRDLPGATPAEGAPRHVVCVVVDALRADAVDPTLTPFLESLSPANAVSPSTWTVPAVASLLTGQYPHEHGAIRGADTYETAVADVTPLPSPPDATTLSERLAGAGYATYGGFCMLVPFLAVSGRFATHRLLEGAPAERLLSRHLSWLRDHADGRTFSYLHLGDLHEPVDPPADYWDAHDVDRSIPGIRRWRHEAVPHPGPTVERYRTHRKRLYQAAAEYVDDRLAAYHSRVGDVADDVLLAVAGDHGEGFWERAGFHAAHFADPRPAYCVGHGGAPYEAITRVPLAFAGADGGLVGPGGSGGRVSLVDVAPTVEEMVGLDPGAQSFHGVSLDGPVPERRLLVEGARYGYEKKAVYAGDRKLVVSRGDDVVAGFSLPDETPRDIPESTVASMREALPPWPDGGRRRTAPATVERRLADLGYT